MKTLEVPPRDTGSIIHDILARYTMLLREKQAPVLSEWLPQQLAEFPPEQAQELLPNLLAFFERNTGEILSAWTVYVEKKMGIKFNEENKLIGCDFDDPDCLLHGVLDRQDTVDLGVVEITDYKTGWSGHDRLQGLIYAILICVNHSGIELVRVRFANPIHNYISEPYELTRLECEEQMMQLLATISKIRRYGITCALSYSSLRKFFLCPAQFAMLKGQCPEEEGWQYRPGKHCGQCEKWADCTVAYPEAPHDLTEAQDLLMRYNHYTELAETCKGLLNQFCAENECMVSVGNVYCGIKASAPSSKTDVSKFLGWLTSRERDPQLPDLDINAYCELKKTKAVAKALIDFEGECPGSVKLVNAPVRFLFGSEKEE